MLHVIVTGKHHATNDWYNAHAVCSNSSSSSSSMQSRAQLMLMKIMLTQFTLIHRSNSNKRLYQEYIVITAAWATWAIDYLLAIANENRPRLLCRVSWFVTQLTQLNYKTELSGRTSNFICVCSTQDNRASTLVSKRILVSPSLVQWHALPWVPLIHCQPCEDNVYCTINVRYNCCTFFYISHQYHKMLADDGRKPACIWHID